MFLPGNLMRERLDSIREKRFDPFPGSSNSPILEKMIAAGLSGSLRKVKSEAEYTLTRGVFEAVSEVFQDS